MTCNHFRQCSVLNNLQLSKFLKENSGFVFVIVIVILRCTIIKEEMLKHTTILHLGCFLVEHPFLVNSHIFTFKHHKHILLSVL